MGTAQIDGRFAPPQAHVEDVAIPRDSLELASRASRFWAMIIDTIVVVVLVSLFAFLIGWDIWDPKDESMLAFKPLDTLANVVMAILPNLYLLAKRGQTIGKVLLKIRTVRPDGSQASLARLVGARLVLPDSLQVVLAVGLVFSLVDALFIFRKPRRCLHDLIADTIVVKA